MKKLLSMAFCAAAAATCGADVITLGYEIGVTKVTIPAGQTSVILASSFKELATENEDICISNIVKTTNLTAGDKILLYSGTRNTYSAWILDDNKIWKPTTDFVLNADGTSTQTTGLSADKQKVSRGTGLFLVLNAAKKDAFDVYLYGKYTNEAATPTIKDNDWNLIGNSSLEQMTLSAKEGDQVVLVKDGNPRTYMCETVDSEAKWYYETTEVTTLSSGKKVSKKVKHVEDPTLNAGEGCWKFATSSTDSTQD